MTYEIVQRPGNPQPAHRRRSQNGSGSGGGAHPVVIALGVLAVVAVAFNIKDVIRYIKISNM